MQVGRFLRHLWGRSREAIRLSIGWFGSDRMLMDVRLTNMLLRIGSADDGSTADGAWQNEVDLGLMGYHDYFRSLSIRQWSTLYMSR